jgi:hypothetical protein
MWVFGHKRKPHRGGAREVLHLGRGVYTMSQLGLGINTA